MNKIIFSVLLLSSSVTVFAQDRRSCDDPSLSQTARNACYEERAASSGQTGQQQGQGQQQLSGNNLPYNDCQRVFNTPLQPLLTAASGAPQAQYVTAASPTGVPTATATAAGLQGYSSLKNSELKKCRGFENIAGALGSNLRETDNRVSSDQKITCVKKSGITADWESCVSAVGMYNTIVVAEAAMQVFQGVQTNNVQKKRLTKMLTSVLLLVMRRTLLTTLR